MEAVEAAGIGHQARPLRLEGLPDRLLPQLGMAMRLGVSDALVHQPGVQLVVALHPEPRREAALPDQADLVLDLPLLPARGWRDGNRLDQVMPAHLQETAVLGSLPAGADRSHTRLPFD